MESGCPSTQSESAPSHTAGYKLTLRQLAKMVRRTESAISKRLMEVERIEDRSFGYWSPAVSGRCSD